MSAEFYLRRHRMRKECIKEGRETREDVRVLQRTSNRHTRTSLREFSPQVTWMRMTAHHCKGLRWPPRHSRGIQSTLDCLCAHTLCCDLQVTGKQRFSITIDPYAAGWQKHRSGDTRRLVRSRSRAALAATQPSSPPLRARPEGHDARRR